MQMEIGSSVSPRFHREPDSSLHFVALRLVLERRERRAPLNPHSRLSEKKSSVDASFMGLSSAGRLVNYGRGRFFIAYLLLLPQGDAWFEETKYAVKLPVLLCRFRPSY